jgi:hypothetical protein
VYRTGSRLLLVLALAAGAAFAGDDIEKRLEELEQRNAKLEKEVEALRGDGLGREIDEYLQKATPPPSEIETKKNALLTFYGFLRMDIVYNTNHFNSVITPVRVLPEPAGGHNDDEFGMTVRLTRVGLLFNFGAVGSLKASGKLEIDFLNFPAGIPESRETPRIRLAYFQLNAKKWMLRVGQEWDAIAPLFPNANHLTLMWFAGNLGDRRPMIRWFYHPSETFTFDTALGLTGAVDNLDIDSDGERDGFDSGMPHLQFRAAWNQLFKQKRGAAEQGPFKPTKLVVGVWGFIGRLEATAGVGPDGTQSFTTWTVGLDASIPVGRLIELRGEAWIGEALSDMRGTAGSSVNPDTAQEVEGFGGWFEIVVRPSAGWQFYLGGSIDDPRDATVPVEAITLNWTTYLGTRRHWTKTFRTTFEVIYWETQYEDGTLGNAVRFALWTSIDF